MNGRYHSSSHPKRLLIFTRGDYITRRLLGRLLESYPNENIAVVIVTGDSHGRTGIAMLSALWKDYPLRFFIFEFGLFLTFKLAQQCFPSKPYSVAAYARSCQIPVHYVSHVNSAKVATIAKQFVPDLIISAKCPQRIGNALLKIAKVGALNVHGSLLPRYAGRAPHFWALSHAEQEIGATIHRMSEEFDEGKILAAGDIPTNDLRTLYEAILKVSDISADLLVDVVDAIDTIRAEPQVKRLRSYFSSPTDSALARFYANGFKLLSMRHLMSTIYNEKKRTNKERW